MTSKRDLVSYTPAQVQDLLNLIPARHATGKRHRALIALLFGAGLRVAELVALSPQDIEETPRGLKVRVLGKGGKHRTVPILSQMRPYVETWLEARKEVRRGRRKLTDADPLLCTLTTGANPLATAKGAVQAGDPMSTDGVRAFLHRLERKGIERGVWSKPLRPHAFRHSYACAVAAAGMAPADIQRHLGHSNLATTSHYLQAYGADEAVDRAFEVKLQGLN